MSKFKIGKDREKLSDQEIQQHMNFNKFLSGHAPVKVWLSKGINLFSVIASTAVVLVATGYLVFHSDKKEHVITKRFINPPIQVMDQPLDSFVFDNIKDTTIVYGTGTLLHLSSESFVDNEGKDIKGPVHIHYREFHDPIDIMLSGIPMNYDSAGITYQLESAGMFEVLAYQNGRPLYLKPGKNISVNMVSHTGNEEDYNIYYLDTLKRKWNYISENTGDNKTCIPIFDRNPAYKEEFAANDLFVSLNKPVLPKKGNSNNYNFIIDFKKNEFPELGVFSGLKFEPVENKKKLYTPLSKKVWDDVLIERHEDNEHYIITFSAEKESHSIKVVPVVDENNYAAGLTEYKKRQQQYEASLAERKKNANGKRDSLYRIKEIYSGAALRSNLNERFNNFIDDNFMETSKDILTYRTFIAGKLGIWNSDRPRAFFAEQLKGSYNAQFVSDKMPILLKQVYLIKRKVNGIYLVSEQNMNHFPFCKGSIDVMVGIGFNNELFYIKDEELKNVSPDNKTIHFTMNKAEVTNVPQLKALLKI